MHFVRRQFLFFLGFTGVCWGITPSLLPNPFYKLQTMDLCKVNCWVPYKMVALTSPGKCAGGYIMKIDIINTHVQIQLNRPMYLLLFHVISCNFYLICNVDGQLVRKSPYMTSGLPIPLRLLCASTLRLSEILLIIKGHRGSAERRRSFFDFTVNFFAPRLGMTGEGTYLCS